jgi:hypothetical protein
VDASASVVHVLPLRWSLSYALTKKQWQEVRERHKRLHPAWEQCDCPKRCATNDLDEHWEYDERSHLKRFVGAKFICRGCHWCKSLPHRIQTWLRQQRGLMPKLVEPPHIIGCLGWTQEQVDKLRDHDLALHRHQAAGMNGLMHQVREGEAVFLPAPMELLSAGNLARLLKPDQIPVVPWRVDLSALAQYEFSSEEIAAFEQRMYHVAAKRMGYDDFGDH